MKPWMRTRLTMVDLSLPLQTLISGIYNIVATGAPIQFFKNNVEKLVRTIKMPIKFFF